VYEGTNATSQDAINFWMSDAIHRIALFDPGLADVGAGVSVVGSTYYYCEIAALASGESIIPGTSVPPAVVVVPMVISTPNPDGSIIHVIQPGDTLLAIAQAYNITLTSLEQLNSMTNTTTIYPGHKLIIRPAYTPTTTRLTSTSSPTQTPTTMLILFSPTSPRNTPSPTSPPAPGMSSSKAGGVFIVIVLVALVSAGAITAHGSKNRR
jgi:LysM repeat protein